MRSLLHSLSSSKCDEGKHYHKKMQFTHSIIQDIYRSGTYEEEFLRRQRKCWSSSEQGSPRVTPMDLVYIQESNKEEGMEQ